MEKYFYILDDLEDVSKEMFDWIHNTKSKMNTWQPISTAIKNSNCPSVLLYCGVQGVPFYCGRWRAGTMYKPQPGVIAWRCDSSGTFANPTHWMPLPNSPD